MHQKIKQHSVPIVAGGIMVVTAVIALTLPQSVSIPSVSATPPPNTMTLPGVVRDFSSSHPDFDITPGDGYGHYTGLVVRRLNTKGRPVYVGDGTSPDEDDFTPPVNNDYGFASPFGPTTDGIDEKQVATQVTIPESGTLKSISAYIGGIDDDIRYAIYADAAGEPGALIVESQKGQADDAMAWYTEEMPETWLDAGTYWLAMSLDDEAFFYDYAAAGGQTRMLNHDAADNGFLSNWGASTFSDARRIAMYATVEVAVLDFHPVMGGEGGAARVTGQFRDDASNPIPPHLNGRGVSDDQKIDFGIASRELIPTESFAMQVTVLGAAIQNSSYHTPVTCEIEVAGTQYEPFGPCLDAVNGNVNDDQSVTGNANPSNPITFVVPGMKSAGAAINITGRSWNMRDSDDPGTSPANWSVNRTAETSSDSPQVMVLRHGDNVPNVPGMYSQASIADYVSDYVDMNTGTMSMGENQVIYLFELGTSAGSSSADFQDLVVVVDLARDPSELGTNLTGDIPGTTVPTTDPGVQDPDTFDQWYRDIMGVNLSKRYDIVLIENGAGVFEYINDDFWPADGQLLGNEGDPHNTHWTYAFTADFTYSDGAGQFFEIEGGDDTWMFVQGHLAIDLGGIQPGVGQRLEMDRLGLTDGEEYTVQFFHARRQLLDASLHVRTSIDFTGNSDVVLSGIVD